MHWKPYFEAHLKGLMVADKDNLQFFQAKLHPSVAQVRVGAQGVIAKGRLVLSNPLVYSDCQSQSKRGSWTREVGM